MFFSPLPILVTIKSKWIFRLTCCIWHSTANAKFSQEVIRLIDTLFIIINLLLNQQIQTCKICSNEHLSYSGDGWIRNLELHFQYKSAKIAIQNSFFGTAWGSRKLSKLCLLPFAKAHNTGQGLAWTNPLQVLSWAYTQSSGYSPMGWWSPTSLSIGAC